MKILLMLLISQISLAGTDFKKYREERATVERKRSNCRDAVITVFRKHEASIFKKLNDKEQEDLLQTFCDLEFPLPPPPPECEDVN